jgi:hypothetical protein
MKNKFSKGNVVKVKGKSGTHVISWPMLVPVPTIIDGQFMMETQAMYKFNAGKNDTFYAYEKDCSEVKK